MYIIEFSIMLVAIGIRVPIKAIKYLRLSTNELHNFDD